MYAQLISARRNNARGVVGCKVAVKATVALVRKVPCECADHLFGEELGP